MATLTFYSCFVCLMQVKNVNDSFKTDFTGKKFVLHIFKYFTGYSIFSLYNIFWNVLQIARKKNVWFVYQPSFLFFFFLTLSDIWSPHTVAYYYYFIFLGGLEVSSMTGNQWLGKKYLKIAPIGFITHAYLSKRRNVTIEKNPKNQQNCYCFY